MGMLEDIKEAVKLVQKIDNIELYRKLLDLQGEVLQFSEQLKNKDKRIEELEAALQIKGNLKLKDSAYYLFDENDQLKDGPFCTKCFDVDQKTCRLLATETEPKVFCPNCKASFASKPIFNLLRPEVEQTRQEIMKKMRLQGEDYPRIV
jgi:hypothetical protein